MAAKGGQIDHLAAATATLRVRVDALLNATDAPKDVSELALNDLRAISAEMKPLAAVASEFRKRWQKQKSSLLAKREAEVEYHLRQASGAQQNRMEEEAENQIYLMSQDFQQRQKAALEQMHRGHEVGLKRVVEEWEKEVIYSDSVRSSMVEGAVTDSIEKIIKWAGQEESRIMGLWEEELSTMMVAVHGLDEEEIQAMEKARAARCNLMESTVERQQQDLVDFRANQQNQITTMSKIIMRKAQPREEKMQQPQASAKRQARLKVLAKKEAEVAAQQHVDAAVRYLDEAAALERARVSAYHTAMQEIGPELAEQLQDTLVSATELASSKTGGLGAWMASGTTSSGLPNTFSSTRNTAGQGANLGSPASLVSEEEDLDAAAILQNEVVALRERARSMMAAVGRGDWRKDILDVADGAIDGLRKTEMALAAGPLQATTAGGNRSSRNTREALSTVDAYARDFSSQALKEFTRMRNVKVALSCSRSKHVREAMQQYEWNSADIEEAIMPAVSKLCHEVEVIREVVHASKNGQERMPIYIIAASFRRSLLATYPALKRLWDAADVSHTDQKSFIRKLAMHLAVEPSLVPIIQAEISSLEATLPAPDWAVAM